MALSVSKEEIAKTKKLLQQRTYMAAVIKDYENNAADTQVRLEELDGGRNGNALRNILDRQGVVYENCKEVVGLLDRAVSLIDNKDIEKMIELKYVQNQTLITVELYFSSVYSSTTVTRYIRAGIEKVATTLKNWGMFDNNDSPLNE